MKTQMILVVGFVAVLIGAVNAEVSAKVTECDRLAANPPDPDRVAEGVPRSEVDVAAAIDACKQALAEDPGNARLAYQLGRVYFYGGETVGALKYMGLAAEQKYRQAEFVMGAVADNRREGVPYDPCKVEDYWYRAASRGHLHARVAYVRHAINGRFASCDIQASPAELRQMIDIDAAGSENYFLRLLVADLRERIERDLEGQN